MGTIETIDEKTARFWSDLYREADVHSPEHGVVVANLGEWAGFWNADRFIEGLGNRFNLPASNRSQVNTLTDAFYARGIVRPGSNGDLLILVDGIVGEIFPDGVDVEWSTLRKLQSVDSVVKRALAGSADFDVVDYSAKVLATLRGYRVERRDYFGNQTDEMVAAIDGAGFGHLLTPKGQEKAEALKETYGDKADREGDRVEKDPDAGIDQAFTTLRRVLTGDRKCHKMAWFRGECEAMGADLAAWIDAYDSADEILVESSTVEV
tara:strand:- start:91 stop:885 length:795 start_codon:yes stop_codon:yes gene_type:complete